MAKSGWPQQFSHQIGLYMHRKKSRKHPLICQSSVPNAISSEEDCQDSQARLVPECSVHAPNSPLKLFFLVHRACTTGPNISISGLCMPFVP
eukprot:1158621-Pelagomonas_calceolata.AAC.4